VQLNTVPVSARTRHSGTEEFVLLAGETLKIETSPGGDELLNVTAPEGKEWQVHITVDVVEV